MTRYLVLTYTLFVAVLALLLGLGDYPNDNFSFRLYGYGRFHPNAVYLAVATLGGGAWWNFVQWRKTGAGPAPTSIHFVLASVWFVVGVAVVVGTWVHPSSSGRVSVFGHGRFDAAPVYLLNVALFAIGFAHLRWWRKSGRPGVTETTHFALANVCFLTAIVLALGIGDHPNSRHYATFYGYGKSEELTAYLAIGLLFTAAFWNLRRWRKAGAFPPLIPPVAAATRPAPGMNWAAVGVISGVLLLLLAVAAVPTSVSVSQPPVVGKGPVATPNPPVAVPVVHANGRLVLIALVTIGACAWAFTRRTMIGAGRPRGLSPDAAPLASTGHWVVVAAWGVAATIVILLLTGMSPEPPVPLFLVMALMVGGVPTVVRYFSRSPAVRPIANREHPDEVPAPAAVPLTPTAVHRVCPQCRAPIAADAPQGLCPRCLMAGAFQSVLRPGRTGPYSGAFEAPTPEEVQEFFPQLEILGLIGQGGMGAVYQARQPNLDRVVAVKLIRPREDNPTFAERFVREAKAMAKLTHPNVVTIYESGEAGGSLYLIMEFIDGVTLREAIRAKTVDPAAALKVVGQLCDALEYAHAQGVVHRDIKPENILLDRAGRVKVVDFGLAKLADDNALSLTHTRQAMGTPHYMAPEQWEKPTEVDHRADIYALGVVIYELLTGELPLGRFDPPSVKVRLDARIDEIVLRLLAKEPDKRYQKASDVRTALFDLGPLAGPVAAFRRRPREFYEYKSKTEYLGWPLVHVVSGIDPRTGTPRIAKGWVAVGDVMAVGALTVSGVFALGGVSVAGVVGLGLLALAGALSLGGVAVGGVSVGVFALGGVAMGWLALGGVAIGKFVIGGSTVGEHHFGGVQRDANFWDNLRAAVSDWFG